MTISNFLEEVLAEPIPELTAAGLELLPELSFALLSYLALFLPHFSYLRKDTHEQRHIGQEDFCRFCGTAQIANLLRQRNHLTCLYCCQNENN
jgi:hypothetical protein